MKKAIVLGGTVPHIELIRQLKERGFYVILIDYFENPPAKKYADEHIQASTLDSEAVLQIASDNKVELVMSSCIEHANSIACLVSEKLGLPHPYSYETSLDVTHKGRMKKIFKEGGVPTSDFYILNKEDQKEIKLPFPLVIKPTDGNSSKGVFKVETPNEFYEKIDQSLSYSREGKAIVEGFVQGVEIQADCVAVNGKAYVLMTSDKLSMNNGGKELQVAGFTIPGKVCEQNKRQLETIAQRIVDSFKLINTPFFYQAICNDNGAWVLEFATRIAGGTRFETVQMYSGYDYIKASISSYLHEPLDESIKHSDQLFVVRHLYMKPGVFDHIEGLDEMLQTGEISQFFPFVVKGREISSSMNSGNRVGAIMVQDTSYKAAEQRLCSIFSKLRIIDINGNDKSYWRN